MGSGGVVTGEMVRRGDYYWPASDEWCWKVIRGELSDLDAAVRLCRGRGLAVQAGGNVGVWANHLARTFEQVVTVEPERTNYECLRRNAVANVTHLRAAFSDAPGFVGMEMVDGNAGAHWISGDGSILKMTIDSFDLPACDLLVLDVEGSEYHALVGAKETIERYGPVIHIEEKGLGEAYFGLPKQAARRWLEGIGYRVVAKKRRDLILTR